MPSGRRTSEPVRMGVATNRPNSVSLRLSSALILIPITENITQTAKFTAKASVLAASAETCSRLYSTLFTVDVVTSVLPWSCARRTASAPFNPHCAASHLPSSIERGPASRDSGRAQRRRGVGRPTPRRRCARQLRECLPLAHGALLLDERCGGALEIDALDRRRTGEELQILAQCRDEALLAQRIRDGAPPGSRACTPTTCRPKRLCTSRGSTPISALPKISRANSDAQSSAVNVPRSPPSAPLGQLDSVRAALAKPSPALPSWQRTSSSVASARLRSATTSAPGVTANRMWRTRARSPVANLPVCAAWCLRHASAA